MANRRSPQKITVICYVLLLVLLSITLPALGATTNVANGNLYHNQQLLTARGTPLALEMSLYYNSMDSYQGSLSQGWTHSYDISLTDGEAGSKLLHDGGSVRLYVANGVGFTSQPGDSSILAPNGVGFLVTYRNGQKQYFGADGKITSITDRYGNLLSFTYTNGDLTAVAAPSGRSVAFEYDTRTTPHRITHICPPGVTTTGPATRKYSFEYDSTSGLLAKVTNPLADEAATVQGFWQYTYENGRLKTVLDPNGKLYTYNYYPDGRIESSVDPEGEANASGVASIPGHTRTLVYNNEPGSIKTTTFTEKDGGVWVYVYDTYAGVLKQKITPDPATGVTSGKAISYAYYLDEARKSDPSYPYGSLKAKTEPFIYDQEASRQIYLTTFYSYDGFGNLINETEPLDLALPLYAGIDPEAVDTATFGTTAFPVKWAFRYAYGAYDVLQSKTDLRGVTPLVTSYSSAVENGYEVVTVTDPEGFRTVIRNNANGTLEEIVNATNHVVAYSYYADTAEERTAFRAGMLMSVTTPDGLKTEYTVYDPMGNAREIKEYDKLGALKVTSVMEYDALTRLRKVTKTTTDNPPIVIETRYEYDLVGNMTKITDPDNKQTEYLYNYRGQVTTIIDADQKETRLIYGGAGCAACGGGVNMLTELHDARHIAENWPSTTFAYDKLGRLERETDPRGKIIRYTYYDNGLVKDMIDASAIPEKTLVSYKYNNRGQLTQKRTLDRAGITLKDATYGYDNNGNLEAAANQHMSYTFSWYKNGRLKTSTDINNKTVSYEYDGAGNRTMMRAPDGMPYFVMYDHADRPYFYYNPAGIFEIFYDDAGRRRKQTSVGFSTEYSYDGLDRLTHILSKNSSGQNYTESVLTYYPSGNRKTRTAPLTEPNVSVAYQYDNLYRLLDTATIYPTFTAHEAYTYDESGNRLSGPTAATSYSYSEGNRLDTKTGVTYSYDDYGNLIGKTEGTKTSVYSYNGENQLEQVLITEQTGTIITVSFKYDPFGRRIEKKIITQYPGNPIISNKIQTFLYDGDRILDATDSTWYPTRYVHGFFGIDDVLAAPILVSSSYTCQVYYDKDPLGSVIRSSMGTQIGYDSFGVPGSSSVSGYAFTGREYDPETGLYYYRARYYDPKVGRFISKDPLAILGNMYNNSYNITFDQYVSAVRNNYLYTDNNPINRIDPDGQSWLLPAIVGGGIAGGWYLYTHNETFRGVVDAIVGNTVPDSGMGTVGSVALNPDTPSAVLNLKVSKYNTEQAILGNYSTLDISQYDNNLTGAINAYNKAKKNRGCK